MTVLEWVTGVLFRPGETFHRAQHELRFGYWWIVLCVFTLEAVAAIYSPYSSPDPWLDTRTILLFVATFLIILFDIQALLLLGAARIFGWQLSWPDALKYIGLVWSLALAEDIVTFYPALTGHRMLVLWVGLPFFLWYLTALSAGIRRITGFSWARAWAISLSASILWRGALLYLTWRAWQAS